MDCTQPPLRASLLAVVVTCLQFGVVGVASSACGPSQTEPPGVSTAGGPPTGGNPMDNGGAPPLDMGGAGNGEAGGGAGGSAGDTGGVGGVGGSVAGMGGETGGQGGMGPAETLLDNPLMPMPPESLADVGLYTQMSNLDAIDDRVMYFKPKYELWSNGLKKRRYLLLPEGTQVDTSVRDAWQFPVGTLVFKTFSSTDAQGVEAPVETRLIRKVRADGVDVTADWEFWTYQWNPELTGATLTDPERRVNVEALVLGAPVEHQIPRRGDCFNCHVGNPTAIIGFDELRLNAPLEGQVETQLEQAMARGLLSAMPPQPWVDVTDPDPLQARVFQYIAGNCLHCHNGLERVETSARYPELDLHPEMVIQNTCNIEQMTVGSKAGLRIVPGSPEESILFLAVERVDPEVQVMPLVGVQQVDTDAVEMFREWITAMEGCPP